MRYYIVLAEICLIYKIFYIFADKDISKIVFFSFYLNKTWLKNNFKKLNKIFDIKKWR